jgi:hypothetical protein
MLPVALMLFRQNSFKPLCLLFCGMLIHALWRVADDELLAATLSVPISWSPALFSGLPFLIASDYML